VERATIGRRQTANCDVCSDVIEDACCQLLQQLMATELALRRRQHAADLPVLIKLGRRRRPAEV